MSTSAIYHHLVPQTYMRSWKHGKSSVYFVKQGEHELGESKNTKVIGGINNYHSIQAGSLNATEQEYDIFFKIILDCYIVKIKDKELTNSEEMNNFFYDFDNWVIIDKLGNEISSIEKNSIKIEITSNYDKTIEEKWNVQYESNWNTIKDNIIKAISDNANSTIISGIMRNDLIEFMVSMEWRTKPYHPAFQNAWSIIKENLIGNLLAYVQIPEKNQPFPFITTAEEEFKHYYFLNQFKKFFKGEGNIMEEVNMIVNDAYVELLIAPEDGEFLTSDNPVCRFTNQDSKLEYVFPICPKIACRIIKGKDSNLKDKYLISHISKVTLSEYNNELKNNCYNGYILRVPDRSLYFSEE